MFKIVDNREEGKDELEQAKKVMIKLLKITHNICVKNNLSYWLDAGTLLGAVRHKGFIPWDDDIDICMPRNDYNKFINICKKELPFDVYLQDQHNGLKKWKWIKLRDKYSKFEQKSELGKYISYHQGIFIDIIPYDTCNSKFLYKKLFLNRRFNKHPNIFIKKSAIPLNIFSSIIVKTFGYNNIRAFFLRNCNNNDFKYLSTGIDICLGFKNFKKNDVFPLKKIEFEKDHYYAPNNHKEYLKTTYGNNYMTLPPIKQRKFHANKIYPFNKCSHWDTLEWGKK